jgi:thiol-disulfide isomerase/thioredoxin
MIKLKGGDDKNSIMAQAAKRMNLPTLNAKGQQIPNNFTSPGSHHHQQQQQQSSSSSSSSAIPDGPTPLASRLGMPSAMKGMEGQKGKKDWSDTSNRINLGAPVYIKGKSHRDDDDEEEEQFTDDRPKLKLGDVAPHSDSDDDDDDDMGGDTEQRLLASMREKRLAQLKATTTKQQHWLALGHGVYTDINQDDFLKSVTSSKYVVCHFYHPTFDTCKIVDHHLRLLCQRHLPTRFIAVNADKAPFFVGKLQVKMLPTVVLFKDGIAVDRVVGFDELGGVDDFKTDVMEKRLAKGGVVLVKEDEEGKTKDGVKGSIRSGNLGKDMQEEDSEGEDED